MSGKARFHHDVILPETYNAPAEEENILKFWHKEKIFEKILSSREEENEGKFTFHSAPVYPTGHPHSGHILNQVIKDVFRRYGHQKNLKVEGRFDWNCHGLPVEHEVDKLLKIKHQKDLHKIGVKVYNDECREFVKKCSGEWKPVFERFGNFIDSNPDPEYCTSSTMHIENIWRVFKELYDKDLVYKDTKPLPYCNGCFTHLSYFESEKNLKELVEPGATVALKIVDSTEKLLIWTSNPWSLVFQTPLCVNPKEEYVKIEVKDLTYILSKTHLKTLYKNPSEYTIVEEFSGEKLHNLKCEPLLDKIPVSTGFQVCGESMPTVNGVGIVPSEDLLMETLKERGQILQTDEVKYKKSFCWQSDTPLVNRAVQSWFIRVEKIVEKLKENITLVNWLPEHAVSKEHFIKWINEHPVDWAVSRSRYWGTPVPIWISPSGDEVVCVGSLNELKQLSGKNIIPDLHKEILDWIVIPSKTLGNPPLRRVPDIFDCWFESSALAFVRNSDQVDFVTEAIEEKSGWFYTTLVLAAALSQPPPFRNVVAHGLTLESNGSKVSKRKYNRNDPIKLCEKYGVDAVRLCMLHSSHADFIFKEEGVAEMAETVVQTLYKSFLRCTRQLGSPSWINYGYMTDWYCEKRNVMDSWILSLTESLLKFYDEEMKAYRVHTFVSKVVALLKQIEQWYIPIRCPELIQNPDVNETYSNTLSCHPTSIILFNVIYRLCLVLAPVAPFVTEYIYLVFRRWMVYYVRSESIHDALLLNHDEKLIQAHVELAVSRMQIIVELVCALRRHHTVPIQYKIHEIVIVHHNKDYRNNIDLAKDEFTKILNSRNIRTSNNHHEFGVTLKVEFKNSSASSESQKILQNIEQTQLESLLDGEEVEEIEIDLEDLEVSYCIPKEVDTFHALVISGDLVVVMKMNKELFFYEEGTLKELTKQLRTVKKKNFYYPSDHLVIYYETSEECLKNLIIKNLKHLNEEVKCNLRLRERGSKVEKDFIEQSLDVKGMLMKVFFVCVTK